MKYLIAVVLAGLTVLALAGLDETRHTIVMAAGEYSWRMQWLDRAGTLLAAQALIWIVMYVVLPLNESKELAAAFFGAQCFVTLAGYGCIAVALDGLPARPQEATWPILICVALFALTASELFALKYRREGEPEIIGFVRLALVK